MSLAHAAVRTAGTLFAILLATGCSKEPGPKLDGVSFPVVVLFGNGSTRVYREPSELTAMHANYIVLNQSNPSLVDAGFKVFGVERLRSVNSSAWLMANPSGATEVTFELKPQRSGADAARAVFTQHLDRQTWLGDRAAQKRSALQKENSLLGMAAVVESKPE